MAAPAMLAAMIGPLFSPHEKALRLPPPERLELRLDDVRLDWRLWVRVAINTSLAGFAVSTVRGGAAFRLEHAVRRAIRRRSSALAAVQLEALARGCFEPALEAPSKARSWRAEARRSHFRP